MRRGAFAALLLIAACVGGETPEADARRMCELRLTIPSGFEPLAAFEEEYRDHIGVRLGFRDTERRELHLAAGIPGEWTEGMPEAGPLSLTTGRNGVLAGDPAHDAWIAMWEQGDVCDPRVVLGNSFARPEFLELLRDAGIAAPDE